MLKDFIHIAPTLCSPLSISSYTILYTIYRAYNYMARRRHIIGFCAMHICRSILSRASRERERVACDRAIIRWQPSSRETQFKLWLLSRARALLCISLSLSLSPQTRYYNVCVSRRFLTLDERIATWAWRKLLCPLLPHIYIHQGEFRTLINPIWKVSYSYYIARKSLFVKVGVYILIYTRS